MSDTLNMTEAEKGVRTKLKQVRKQIRAMMRVGQVGTRQHYRALGKQEVLLELIKEIREEEELTRQIEAMTRQQIEAAGELPIVDPKALK